MFFFVFINEIGVAWHPTTHTDILFKPVVNIED